MMAEMDEDERFVFGIIRDAGTEGIQYVNNTIYFLLKSLNSFFLFQLEGTQTPIEGD